MIFPSQFIPTWHTCRALKVAGFKQDSYLSWYTSTNPRSEMDNETVFASPTPNTYYKHPLWDLDCCAPMLEEVLAQLPDGIMAPGLNENDTVSVGLSITRHYGRIYTVNYLPDDDEDTDYEGAGVWCYPDYTVEVVNNENLAEAAAQLWLHLFETNLLPVQVK